MKTSRLQTVVVILFIILRNGFSGSVFLLSSMPSNQVPTTTTTSSTMVSSSDLLPDLESSSSVNSESDEISSASFQLDPTPSAPGLVWTSPHSASTTPLTDIPPIHSKKQPTTPNSHWKASSDASSDTVTSMEINIDAHNNSIFNELKIPGSSLIEKIIGVEDKLCNNTCGEDFPIADVKLRAYGRTHPCTRCYCDAVCAQYNDCCPDVYLMRRVNYRENSSECFSLRMTITKLWPGKSISIFNKCYAYGPISNGDKANEMSHRRKCEQPNMMKLDESVLVSDTSTRVSYRNIYCALCNGVSVTNIHRWKFKVSCSSQGLALLNHRYTSVTEVYHQLIAGELGDVCDARHHTEDLDIYSRLCWKPIRQIVSRCNQTGNVSSSFYDAEIELACQMYSSLFKTLLYEYKNVFCFMCNTNRHWTIGDLWRPYFGNTNDIARLAFSVLINFDPDTVYKNEVGNVLGNYSALTERCSSTQFFDNATCSCKDVWCDALLTFDPETNSCQGGQVEGLSMGYHACLRVYVAFDRFPPASWIETLADSLASLLPTIRLMVTVSHWCPRDKRLIVNLKSWAVDGNMDEHGYAFEKTFDADGNIFCQFIQDQRLHNTAFSSNSINQCDVQIVDNAECPIYNQFSQPCTFDQSLRVKQTVVLNIMSLNLYPYKRYVYDGNSFGKIISQRYGDPDAETNIAHKKGGELLFFPYRRTDHCPYVNILPGEFHATGGTLIHRISLRIIDVAKVEFIQNNTIAKICRVDYIQWSKNDSRQCENKRANYDDHHSPFDASTTAGLISVTTSCISLFFLFLTFMTFLLFAEIRTRGCINLMILTVLLFIAQALYEFTIEQSQNQILCRVWGVLIHYFWLASIFSMNACTIERFIKLCFPLKSRYFFTLKKHIVIATLYTFLCPLVVVGSNIVANVAFKNQFGYGNSQLCYINGRYSRIISFVVPMCAILVMNVVLLGITIITLRRQPQVGSRQKNASGSRIGLVACVRLSVVTGGTWFVSLLYEVIPIEALGYVFTAFLGLQGVVFFFSLMGNGRILELYRKRLTPKAQQRSESNRRRTEASTTGTNFLSRNDTKN